MLQLKPKPSLIQFLSKLTLLISTSVKPERTTDMQVHERSEKWTWVRVKFASTSVTGLEKVSVLLAECVEIFLACAEGKI